MKSQVKDYLKSFSAVHGAPEKEMLPDNVEDVVREPADPSDLSDIYTTQYTSSPMNEPKITKSIIQRDMIVHGSIESKSDIDVIGTVNGDITSDGRINVSGFVSGNISGLSVDIRTKELNANINAREKVVIDKESIINGNIEAGIITVNGSVNGNIKAANDLMVMACATVTGDIETLSMEVNRGAVINGKVTFIQKK